MFWLAPGQREAFRQACAGRGLFMSDALGAFVRAVAALAPAPERRAVRVPLPTFPTRVFALAPLPVRPPRPGAAVASTSITFWLDAGDQAAFRTACYTRGLDSSKALLRFVNAAAAAMGAGEDAVNVTSAPEAGVPRHDASLP